MLKKKSILTSCRIATFLVLAAITYLSLIPAPPVKGVPSDKINHFIAYGVLSLLAFLSVKQPNLKKNLLIMLFCILFGCLMEIFQSFVGRFFEYADMLANTSGVLIGYGIYWLASLVIKRTRIPE